MELVSALALLLEADLLGARERPFEHSFKLWPLPQALAQDDYFETVLSDYAFRHHVKPGVTGWAQCNGPRSHPT